ncbi:MAG TPA: hypothetical protein VMY06_13630 [Sedimentisphaerales bacterium]|nr:hypothetical protein [Sedimentisphaerales bacterium]
MDEKIEIPISESQKKLLQQEEVSNMIIDMDVARAISTIVLKGDKYFVYLDPSELEDLIGTICFVANHEEKNSKLVRQLDKLSEYLDKYLDE